MLTYATTDEPFPMSPELAQHLGSGSEYTHDRLRESWESLLSPEEEKDSTWLYDRLPQGARLRTSTSLCANFVFTSVILNFKLFTPRTYGLNCRAEELLLWWILDEARGLEEGDGTWCDDLREQREAFIDGVFTDLDFVLMYEPALDGIETEPALGVGSLALDHWFLPFTEDALEISPFLWPADKGYWHPNWRDFRYPR